MHSLLTLLVLLAVFSRIGFDSAVGAADVAKAPAAGAALKQDTARGDKMIADYFRAETARLAERTLADINTLDDWKAKRDTFRGQLFEMLSLDPLPPKTDLKAKTTGTVEHEDFTVENVHFQSSPGLYVTGNLYIPKQSRIAKRKLVDEKDAKTADKDESPYPTILYVCGHGGVKKNGVSYGNKTYYTHHGSWFARHGYVCLMIDSLQLGEIEGIHHGTYRYGMWWWLNRGYTPAGVEAWNCIRALDYLETRKEVDKTRMGVTGRSGGGAYSWWIAALDDRIKVAVPGAGITDLTNHVVDGVVEGHCDCMYMHNTYRWDYAQVAALVAPRPLLISNTDKDTIFPLDGVVRLHAKVAKIYKLHDAEKNLGLNIVEGPHKDSQELQLGSFVWFDRYLKGGDRVVEVPAVKITTPEQLRVFEKLPEDQRNTKIQEEFVATAKACEPAKDKAEFEAQREVWMKALREQVFAGWPSEAEAGGMNVKLISSMPGKDENSGLRFNLVTFDSQATVPLELELVSRREAKKLDVLILHVLDDHAWEQSAIDAETRKLLLANDVAIARFCPRGVGPTAWDQSEKKQTQHRRRFMLLGQTLDGMQVWDIRRAVQALREVVIPGPVSLKSVPLTLRGERVMSGNVLYASLFEDGINLVELKHLKPTHREGPIYMNISRHLEIPQAAAMAASRVPLKLEMALDGDWSYFTATAKNLGWDAKRASITIAPPPAGPTPPKEGAGR